VRDKETTRPAVRGSDVPLLPPAESEFALQDHEGSPTPTPSIMRFVSPSTARWLQPVISLASRLWPDALSAPSFWLLLTRLFDGL
jgi:hypothetical protein